MTRAGLCLALALAGCYSPEARDCTVSCSAARDCINGQVCGADHFCAAPSVAGHCTATDAAPPSPDAPAEHDVAIQIVIAGNGIVAIQNVGTCMAGDPDKGMCTFHSPAHIALSITATAIKSDHSFQMWTDGCSGSAPTCALTPSMDVRVGAKFQ